MFHCVIHPNRMTDSVYCALGGEAGGYFEVFLKYGQPPGWHYGQWDFRQAYQYYQTEEDKDQEVKFDAQTEGFQTGVLGRQYLPPVTYCSAGAASLLICMVHVA